MPMSRWLLPVPESLNNTTSSPASIHAALASAANVAGASPGRGREVEVLEALEAGEAGLRHPSRSTATVALVDLGREHLGQMGAVG